MTIQTDTSPQPSLQTILSDVLEEELRALRKLPDRIPLVDGVRLDGLAGHSMYRFEVPENVSLSPYLERVTIQIGRVRPLTFAASVCAVENQFVTLAFPFDLGPAIAEAECAWDYGAAFEDLKRGLIADEEGTIPLDLLFDPSGEMNRFPPDRSPDLPPDLPPEHTNAVQKVFENRVTLLWGPIRSGKTRVLSAVATHYVKAGKNVLFVAGANERVDDVLVESVERGGAGKSEAAQYTARVGLPAPHRVRDVSGISLDHQVYDLRRRKQEELGQQFRLYEQVRSMRVKYAVHDEYFSRLSQLRGIVDGNKRQVDRLTGEINALKETITRIEHASVVNRLRKGFGKEDMMAAQKQLKEKMAGLKRAQAKQTALSGSLIKLEAESPVDTDEWTEYQRIVKQIDEREGLEAFERSVADQTVGAEEALLKTKKFIGTTVVGALTHPHLKKWKADLVIIDDAEHIPVPLIAALAHKAQERLVIAGDPFQVGPSSASVSAAVREWIQTDIFQRIAGTDSLPTLFDWAKQNSQWSVLLPSHYASTPKLSRFVGSVLFDEKIAVTVPPGAKGHVYLIDTSVLGGENVQYIGKRRILPHNRVHAERVIELLKHAILESGVTFGDIGIITPFQGHTSYLKRQLRIHGLDGIEVGTPQSFHGRRKKVVIADTAVGGVDYTLKQIDDVKIGEHQLVRILNTIFSCVEEDLYLLADLNHIQNVYKGRLLGKVLLLLQSEADSLPKTRENVKRFDTLHWDERAALLTDEQEEKRKAVASRLRNKPIEDLELAIRLKTMAKQREGVEEAGPRNLVQETYLGVLNTIGMFKDLNYLSLFTGGEVLFHRTPAALDALTMLPKLFCGDESQFRKATDAWNLLIYELSGGSKTTNPYFVQTAPEARARWDLSNLKAMYSPDVESALEEGKHKIAASATRIFQETLGKPQPENQADWTNVYLSFLTQLQLYFRWISDELRK